MTTSPNSGFEIIAPGASGQSSSELINPVFRSADLLCGTAHSLPCIHSVTDTLQLRIPVPVVSRLLRLFGSLSYGARPFKRDFTRSVRKSIELGRSLLDFTVATFEHPGAGEGNLSDKIVDCLRRYRRSFYWHAFFRPANGFAFSRNRCGSIIQHARSIR